MCLSDRMARIVVLWLWAAVAACGVGCTSATVDSHMNAVSEIEYATDDGEDYWQTPQETIRRGKGDCEDHAFYLQRLLRRDGVAARVVFGVRDARSFKTGHAWVECEMFGETYVVDPTVRLLTRRQALPVGMYYAVGDLPFLVKKLREYLGRCGDRAKL